MSRHKSLIIALVLAVVVPLSSVIATAQVAGEGVGRDIMRMAREKKTGRKETPPAKTVQETKVVEGETNKTIKVVATPPAAAISGDELLNILPANCLACIRINNLDTTLGAVDQYVAGISPFPLGLLAKAQLGEMLGNPTLEGINSQGDFAVFATVLPGNSTGADMMPEVAVGMLIPVTGPEFSQRIPNTELPGTNYVLVMLDAMESTTAVRKHLLSSSFAAGLTAATARESKTTPVWGYVNIAKAVELFGPMAFAQLDQAKEMMVQASAQPGVSQANTKMAAEYLDFMKQYAGQLDSLSLNITPEPDALQLSLTLAAKPNTELAGLLAKDPAMKPGYRLAGFLDSPAAINFVAKTNKPLFMKLNTLTIDMFAQAIGDTLSPAQIQNWKTMMAEGADNMGQEVAISFSFASAMPPIAIKEIIHVPDPKVALDQVTKGLQLANEMYKAMGLDATVATEPEPQRYKGVQIHALRFNMKAPAEATEEDKLIIESMFGGSVFSFKFAAAGSFMLVAGGPDADKDLRQLIDQALSGRIAPPTGDIKTAMAAIPNAASTDFVASVNVIRLLSGVGVMVSAMPIPGGEMIGQMFSELDMPTESCIALAGKVDDGSATLQIALPKQHLLEIVEIGAKLQGAMGAAGPGMFMGSKTESFTVKSEDAFSFSPTPENTVTIKIVGIADDAAEDAITDKLMEMPDMGSMTWTTVNDVLVVEMAPVKDVKAFARKIKFGKVTEVKDKTITVQVGATDSVTIAVRDTEEPTGSITIKIVGIADDATEKAITDKLKTMTDGDHSMSWYKMGGVLNVELSPVRDVEAFARKIDFGTVTEVKDRTVTVQVNK